MFDQAQMIVVDDGSGDGSSLPMPRLNPKFPLRGSNDPYQTPPWAPVEELVAYPRDDSGKPKPFGWQQAPDPRIVVEPAPVGAVTTTAAITAAAPAKTNYVPWAIGIAVLVAVLAGGK